MQLSVMMLAAVRGANHVETGSQAGSQVPEVYQGYRILSVVLALLVWLAGQEGLDEVG